MAISVVQSATIGAFTSPPITFASNVTAGNTVFIAICAYHTGAGTITTSAPTLGGSSVAGSVAFFNPGTTSGITSGVSGDGNEAYVSIWMMPNCPGGSKTVSWTTTGQSGLVGCFALEVSGLGTTPVLDQFAQGAGINNTAISSGSTGPTATSPEIVLAVALDTEGYANQPGGWTLISPSSNGNGGYQLPVSSGSNYTWSQTGSAAAAAWATGVVTVAASLPVIPAPVYPQQRPAQARRLPRRGGQSAANPGGPVRNPNVVTAYGAIGGAIRAALPFAFRGRVTATPKHPPPPPAPPTSGPPFVQRPGPVRAPIPQVFSTGYAITSPVTVGLNPTAGPPFYPKNRAVRARPPLRAIHGRASGTPGKYGITPPPVRVIVFRLGVPRLQWQTGSTQTSGDG